MVREGAKNAGGRRYINNTGPSSVKEENPVVHHVPFKIEYEGQANVDVKFTSNSVPLNDSKVMINQFRGRPLQGECLELPEKYEGLVAADMRKSSKADDDDDNGASTEIAITKRFDSMTYWNWDRVPSGMDKHVKLKDWLELSEVLHAPIDSN